MYVPAYIANVFTKNGSGGNKAGIIFDEGFLDSTQKQDIAKKLGYSETVFALKSDTSDFKLEYFTPQKEISMCGHATIGFFVILRHLNKLTKKNYTIETNHAILNIIIKNQTIFIEQQQPIFYDNLKYEQIDTCFEGAELNPNYPIQIVSTGVRDILIPIINEKKLRDLKPNFEEIKLNSQIFDVVGMHLYTIYDKRILCRNFAPLYGIDEEAATGTSNAALATYLYKNNIVKKDSFVFEQGYNLGQPSEIQVKLKLEKDTSIKKVYIGGNGQYLNYKSLKI